MPKLTIEQGIEIYYKLKSGIHKVYLCDEYDISPSVLYCIEKFQFRWKCLIPLLHT